MPQSRVCVIIPAHNEEPSIARVVAGVRKHLPAALPLVVDDGSNDDTAERAKAAGATLIRLPINLGIGGAVQTGFLFAYREGFDVAIQIDGDGQHDPAEASQLLLPIRTGTADLVIGSRWSGRGQYAAPVGRRFGMRLLAVLARLLTGLPLSDTTSGFRAAGPRAIRLFAQCYPVDFPEPESIILAHQHGLSVGEVPVAMNQRGCGKSSISGLRSGYYMARVCLGLMLGAWKSLEP